MKRANHNDNYPQRISLVERGASQQTVRMNSEYSEVFQIGDVVGQVLQSVSRQHEFLEIDPSRYATEIESLLGSGSVHRFPTGTACGEPFGHGVEAVVGRVENPEGWKSGERVKRRVGQTITGDVEFLETMSALSCPGGILDAGQLGETIVR